MLDFILKNLKSPLSRVPPGTTGAGIDNTTYVATITSYDYDTFISEAGGYNQPGVGGDGNKFQVNSFSSPTVLILLPVFPYPLEACVQRRSADCSSTITYISHLSSHEHPSHLAG